MRVLYVHGVAHLGAHEKGIVMGKFVARSFTPGIVYAEVQRLTEEYAYVTAWEAWEDLLQRREDAQKDIHGDAWIWRTKSTECDMNELAQPDAYDDDGVFGVASLGREWLGSFGAGTLWAPSPGVRHKADKGVCYQVSWETQYVGL